MKKLFISIFLIIISSGFINAQTIWFVNSTNGDDIICDGLSPNNTPPGTGPKRSITGVINTGALLDGDIINIAAGIYNDSPTISKNITINGHSFNANTDVTFDVSTASISFTMPGQTIFSLNAVSSFGLTPASRFYFIGSTNTGMKIYSGSVLLSTAYFYITAPFLFQTNIPASTGTPTNTWYVDITNGYDGYLGQNPTNSPLGSGPVTTITKVTSMSLQNDDVINIAAGNYNDGPEIFKNIKINGYSIASSTEIGFNLSTLNMIFHMTGRTIFKTGGFGSFSAADKFHLIGSLTTGIFFNTGCVQLLNTTFNISPPFLFQGIIAPTGITEQKTVSEHYNLAQCYPNPFNPSTTISYTLSGRNFVNITIYDVLGNEISTLVNEEKDGGKYEVKFNAASLSSGIYFYTIRAGTFRQTQKMVLLK